MELSPEQQAIIEAVLSPSSLNVLVNACAGSGKTTVSLAAAEKWVSEGKGPVLYLTYSKRLKEETRLRSAVLNSVHVHTFHSSTSATTISKKPSRNDEDFAINVWGRIQGSGSDELLPSLPFTLLVIDEGQDLTPRLATYLRVVLSRMPFDRKVLLVGDYFQCIFPFLFGASPEYLLDPGYHFGGEWRRLFLRTSFRLGHKTARWVNKNLDPRKLRDHYPKMWARYGSSINAFWGEGIVGGHDLDTNPIEIEGLWNVKKNLAYIRKLLKNHKAADVAFVAQGLTPISPAGKIVATFDKNLWVVKAKGEQVLKEQLPNKSLVITIQSFKGCERPGIAAFGVTEFLERPRAVKDQKSEYYPLFAYNMAYVMCTRASRQLMVFTQPGDKEKFATMRKRNGSAELQKPKRFAASEMGLYLPFEPTFDSDEALGLEIECSIGSVSPIQPCVDGKANDTREQVSDIVGLAIERAILQPGDWNTILQGSLQDEYGYRRRQLGRTWTNQIDFVRLDALLARATALLPNIEGGQWQAGKDLIFGRIFGRPDLVADFICPLTDSRRVVVVELKCTADSPPSHTHQLAVYGYLLQMANAGIRPVCYLVNAVRGTRARLNGIEDYTEHTLLLLRRAGHSVAACRRCKVIAYTDQGPCPCPTAAGEEGGGEKVGDGDSSSSGVFHEAESRAMDAEEEEKEQRPRKRRRV